MQASSLQPTIFWKARSYAMDRICGSPPDWFGPAMTSPSGSEKFEREWTDLLSVQDEISRGIVNSLRLKLGRGRRRYEMNVEAYDFYLRARAMEVQHPARGENY